ncbi:MAG TPA: GAF domain-containing protein [Gaiellaceae bacterium]|nr:GAF domain-containing protein [Gaiellaceae bacterium]
MQEERVGPVELSFDALCVIGFDGAVKLAANALARMLGYRHEELLEKPFVDLVHPDDRESVVEVLAELMAGKECAGFECRQLCSDGSVRLLEWNTRAAPAEDVIYGVARDITEWRGAGDELSAIRHLTALVARGLPSDELFTAIAAELARLFDDPLVGIFRYDPDLTATVVAASADLSPYVGRSLTLSPDDPGVVASARRTRRPVRLDVGVAGADFGAEFGVGAALGVPVVVEDTSWGVVTLGQKEGRSPLPLNAIDRVTGFTHLVATAIANAESRAESGRLVEEQASMRRVATLVARGTRPAEVFAAVAEEVGRVIDVDSTSVLRYEADKTVTVVAISGENILTPVGSNWTLEGESIASRVFRTGRPARMNSFDDAAGLLAELARKLGRRSAVGAPIIVDDHLWGAAVANSVTGVLPAVAEDRLAKFAELVAMAISNAEARTELNASRARVVTAADETRRRIERDLHDGIQQRLVAIALQARVTAMMTPRPSDEIQGELALLADQLTAALDELREIARGIHPAILSEAGLSAALKTLARRSAIPVALDLNLESRLEEPIEVAAYYIASEALTNTVKHAHASLVELHVDCDDGILTLALRDDGIGGADPGGGSGLIGLQDRVEALGGTLSVASPPGQGTLLRVVLPADASAARPPPPSTQRPAAA